MAETTASVEPRLKQHRSRHAKIFGTFAERASFWAGTSIAFVCAVGFIVVWVLSGPFFHYSSHWEALVSEVPGLVTFLLVFLIQNSQGRELKAIQLKLNELIRATNGAHTMMLNLEKLTEEELSIFCDHYEKLAQEARGRLSRGESDKDVVDIPSPETVIQHVAETAKHLNQEVAELKKAEKASPRK